MGDKPIPDPDMLWPPVTDIAPFPQNLVKRVDWGAEHPIKTKKLKFPIKFVRMNYTTETERCMNIGDCIKTVKQIQARDIQDTGMTDIQYNFLVGGDARIYEGRGWNVAPHQSIRYRDYNGRYLEIAYVGDHKDFTVQPSFGMMKAAWDLIEYGINNRYIYPDFTFL